MATESLKNLGISSKEFTGSTNTYSLANKVNKPTTAVDENIAVFDTNEDSIKDSGYSINDILAAVTGVSSTSWTTISTAFEGNWTGNIHYRVDTLGFVHIRIQVSNSSVSGTISNSTVYK